MHEPQRAVTAPHFPGKDQRFVMVCMWLSFNNLRFKKKKKRQENDLMNYFLGKKGTVPSPSCPRRTKRRVTPPARPARTAFSEAPRLQQDTERRPPHQQHRGHSAAASGAGRAGREAPHSRPAPLPAPRRPLAPLPAAPARPRAHRARRTCCLWSRRRPCR